MRPTAIGPIINENVAPGLCQLAAKVQDTTKHAPKGALKRAANPNRAPLGQLSLNAPQAARVPKVIAKPSLKVAAKLAVVLEHSKLGSGPKGPSTPPSPSPAPHPPLVVKAKDPSSLSLVLTINPAPEVPSMSETSGPAASPQPAPQPWPQLKLASPADGPAFAPQPAPQLKLSSPTDGPAAPPPAAAGLKIDAKQRKDAIHNKALDDFGHSIIALFNSRPAHFMSEALKLEEILLNKLAQDQSDSESPKIIPLS